MSAQTGREATFAAVFAKLAGISGVQSASRAWKADVPANEQPALFLVQGHQDARTGYRLPIKWAAWHCEILVYALADPVQGILAATQLNTILDAIEAAVFTPDHDGAATLGGTVSHIGIDGTVEIYEGATTGQAVALIPVVIVPNS